MSTLDELTALAKAIHAAPRDIRTLLDLTGLDPANDFRNLNLRNVDFSHCDLTGFDFTGTSLRGCTFTGARIDGVVFDAHHLAHAAIFRDAIGRPRFPSTTAHFVISGDNAVDVVALSAADDTTAVLSGTGLFCALASASLGSRTSFLGAISTDEHGDRIRSILAAAGADTLPSAGVKVPTSNNPVTFDEALKATSRHTAGADQVVDRESLEAAMPRSVSTLCLNGLVVSNQTAADAWISLARKAAADGAIVAMDLEMRPHRIDDIMAFRRDLSDLMRCADIIKLSKEDLFAWDQDVSPETFATESLGAGARLIVVTSGDSGAVAFTRNAAVGIAAFMPNQLGDTVGAGSAYMAGLLTGLARIGLTRPRHLDELTEETLHDVLRYASVVAGLSCSKRGFYPPSPKEVSGALLNGLSAEGSK